MNQLNPGLPRNWQKNFYIFLTGQFLSGITSMIVQYSIIWYLTMQTKSATILSIATILGMLPMVLLSPFIGGLIDRTNKKALLIITDAVVAFFAVILSIAGSLNSTFPLWLVFVSLFMRSLAQTFQNPTIQSAMPAMVAPDKITQSNGQFGMIQSANMIIAPALGAFLFSIVPIQYLILLDVIGFIFGAGMILLVKIPDNSGQNVEKTHPVTDAIYGFKLLRNKKGLWAITMIGAFFTLLFMPVGSMYPLMTVNYFHGTVAQAGIVEVIWSIGMLVGGAFIGMAKSWNDRIKPMFLGFIAVGVFIAASAILPSTNVGFWIFVGLNALAGFSAPFINTMMMAMIQESFAPESLGRVMGVLNSVISIAGPVGLVLAGPLGDQIGVQNLFLIGGIGAILGGLMLIFIKNARNYDQNLKATQSLNKDVELSETK